MFCPDNDLHFAVEESYDFGLYLDQRASNWLEIATDI